MRNTILQGDALAILRTLPKASVQACVTSPPYWNLRNYGVEGQLGLEDTPEAYVTRLVEVFREVRRVLCDDGVLWLNMGDSYAGGGPHHGEKNLNLRGSNKGSATAKDHIIPELKSKNLIGIPWRVAFALQSDGWILRSDVIWHKPNAMPESVKDRPTKAHEYLFLLAKNERYYYDADAIAVERTNYNPSGSKHNIRSEGVKLGRATNPQGGISGRIVGTTTRNRRTVWDVATVPYKGAHFAVMPVKLVEPCILASSRPGDIILDPFAGAGTVPLVASQLERDYIGIELNPEYITLAEQRLSKDKAA